MTSPRHHAEAPEDRQGCPGCGNEDMTRDEMERGQCDECTAAAVFAKARQCGWNVAQVRYMYETEAEIEGLTKAEIERVTDYLFGPQKAENVDKYGRVDTDAIRLLLLGPLRTGASHEIHLLIAVAEAADLYAADQSAERLALLNECLDALPQLAVKA